ncbi:DUF742 domain-containing protein [Luedemannella flava]|uniref:DUF742 domain-containing protein n=1 Tax=Luedemannella flava TaxID=349316 RepID=A0ABN2MRR1_9ACTN
MGEDMVRPYLRDGPMVPALPADAASLLRPYLQTSGRVEAADDELEIEAQVVTSAYGLNSFGRLAFEHRDIVALCATTMSVAEVAARLALHIGVAKVLVADLAALGCLVVERPDPEPADDLDMIERVIRGLEGIR